MKRTKQFEDIQNLFDRLENSEEETGIVYSSSLRDDQDEFNVSHEEALSKLRQHQEDVLSDFERQLQAVKGKKLKPEKINTNKNMK